MSVTVKDILTALGLLTGVTGLFKKKPHKLLKWNVSGKRWERTHDGAMSARNCRKLLAELQKLPAPLPVFYYIIVRDSVHEDDIPAPVEPPR